MEINIKQDKIPANAQNVISRAEGAMAGPGDLPGSTARSPESAKELKMQILMEQEAQKLKISKTLQPESAKQDADSQKTSDKENDTSTESSRSGSGAVISSDLQKYLSRLDSRGNIKMWVLEMEMKIWEELLNWLPSSQNSETFLKPGSIIKDLDELAALYRQLAQAVMDNTGRDGQALQMERLDRAVSAAVNRLLDTSMMCTKQYFSQYGTGDLTEKLRASIFYHVTGRTASPDALERFWSMGKGGVFAEAHGGSSGRFASHGGQTIPAGQIIPTGQTSGSSVNVNKPAFHRAYLAQANTQSISDWQPSRINQRAGIRATVPSGMGIYVQKDLELAENFFRHLEKGGNLFLRQDITARNPELAGFLQGVIGIKAQCLGASSAMSRSMSLSCCTVAEQLIHYCLFSSKEATGWKDAALHDSKQLYKVYNFILNQFREDKDLTQAMNKGLLFAFSLFDEKKKNPSNLKSPYYGDTCGFFHKTISGEQEPSARKAMKKSFEQDIRQYDAVAQGNSRIPDYRRAGEAWQMQQNPFRFTFPRGSKLWWIAAAAAAGAVISMAYFR